MTTIALSTMYAQQKRFDSGEAFACYAAEAGYDAIEVSHSTPEEKLREILDCGVLPWNARPKPEPSTRQLLDTPMLHRPAMSPFSGCRR